MFRVPGTVGGLIPICVSHVLSLSFAPCYHHLSSLNTHAFIILLHMFCFLLHLFMWCRMNDPCKVTSRDHLSPCHLSCSLNIRICPTNARSPRGASWIHVIFLIHAVMITEWMYADACNPLCWSLACDPLCVSALMHVLHLCPWSTWCLLIFLVHLGHCTLVTEVYFDHLVVACWCV